MALLQSTRNYRDLSTETGFRFEFFCDRCGNGYQTEFQSSALSTVSSALDVANNLFDGVFGRWRTRRATFVQWSESRLTITPSAAQWRMPNLISINANVVPATVVVTRMCVLSM